MQTQHKTDRWVAARPKKIRDEPKKKIPLLSVMRIYLAPGWWHPNFPNLTAVNNDLYEMREHSRRGKHLTDQDILDCRTYRDLKRRLRDLRDYLNDLDLDS